MDVPKRWTQLRPDILRGLVMIVGAPDVGKTTLARYLYEQLAVIHPLTAYIDGDPGQSTLGLPGTITMALSKRGDPSFPPAGLRRQYFIGDVSPRAHMLPMLVGARRLADEALHAGAQVVLYDTCGLIDPSQGGHALKQALIEVLQPGVVFALQRDRELETLLLPWRLSRRVRVVDLPASPLVVPRDLAARRARRQTILAHYFAPAGPLEIHWGRLAVFPSAQFKGGRMVALEDAQGFVLGLGIVIRQDWAKQSVTLHTPLHSTAEVNAIRLGDILLDPQTYMPAGSDGGAIGEARERLIPP
jgi:polynucleotide 5'-hydroxyl-kinase GRC3/NOL9